MRKKVTEEQLSFNLSVSDEANSPPTTKETAQIITFVDAETLRTRGIAITQLARAGIFRVPDGLERFVN